MGWGVEKVVPRKWNLTRLWNMDKEGEFSKGLTLAETWRCNRAEASRELVSEVRGGVGMQARTTPRSFFITPPHPQSCSTIYACLSVEEPEVSKLNSSLPQLQGPNCRYSVATLGCWLLFWTVQTMVKVPTVGESSAGQLCTELRASKKNKLYFRWG